MSSSTPFTPATTLLAATCLAALALPVGAAAQAAPTPRNTRQAYLSAFDIEANASGRAFFVSESDQGGTDLNGDGDTNDVVVRVLPAGSGPIVGPALAVDSLESLQMVADRVVLVVQEFGQGGVDLNGDGDTSDLVLHLLDASTGQVANLGRVYVHGGIRLTETSLFLHVSELEEGLDVNGDGDRGDYVLERLDLASGVVQTIPLALEIGVQLVPQLVDGDVVVVLADEAHQGQDLNGDGDLGDGVAQLPDAASGVKTSTGLAVSHPMLLRLEGDTLALGVSEANQGGTDLNADGDAQDAVLYLVDAATSGVVPSGLALERVVDLERGLVAFAVGEAGQGAQDLNGDGDAQDQVLHLLDLAGGAPVNLGLALPAKALGQVRATSGRLTGFLVDESGQGGLDLDGDGDAVDEVWFVHDRLLGVTTNLRLAWSPQALHPYVHAGPDFVLVAAGELATGGRDLTGDGDTTDLALMLYSASASVPTRLGTALSNGYWGFGSVDGRRLVIGLPEAANGGRDLNGDGDTLDRVAHVVDVP